MNIILFLEDELNKPLLKHDPRFIHIRRILKLTTGDTFKAGIINGNRGTATIKNLDSQSIQLDFELTIPTIPFKPVRIICGLPRPQQAKRILRDCASTGVSHIWFFHSDLGEKSYQHSPLWQNNAWMHCVREGIEQSGGTLFPDVHIFSRLSDCIAELPDHVVRIALDNVDSDNRFPNGFLTPDISNPEMAVFIGSERGWTPHEKALLLKSHCRPVTFGNRILRSDSSCIAAAVLATALQFR